MIKLESSKQLYDFRSECIRAIKSQKISILICGGTGCISGGSFHIYDRFNELAKDTDVKVAIKEENASIGIKKSGCNGFCEMGPIVLIEPLEFLYVKVKPDDCDIIWRDTILGGKPIEDLMYKFNDEIFETRHNIPFYSKQTRLVLRNCGTIDAESINEYIAMGGYRALEKVLFEMTADDIINAIIDSGLRGRGGGGYPTGRKWFQVKKQNETVKYIVCNGDEGDPGAFMDRSVMEGDPHRMIEGMIIASVATGAEEGYIYVRAEYPMAVKRLRNAIEQAEEKGLLGENILGSDKNFKLHINQGAGAFVCGEGSAMTASIEGNRGTPRTKPPRTVEHGLFGKPTVLNNVETFANVPSIINHGVKWYKSIGTEKSPGTKAFALTGNVNNTGLIEVPMGTTLREIIYDIGGGIRDNKKFKAVQIGGPSGGCLTEKHLDMPLDFDSLSALGAMIGSGGLVVMDEDTCMVEIARYFMNFTQNESCGKCVPCREGTKRMLEILERIVSGKGEKNDLDLLKELSDTIKDTSLCGLGKTASSPIMSTLKFFEEEYLAHVKDKKCPSKVCQALKRVVIDEDLCKGCTKCVRVCPVAAIKGKVKEPHIVDDGKCIKCGGCIESCAFNAIREVF